MPPLVTITGINIGTPAYHIRVVKPPKCATCRAGIEITQHPAKGTNLTRTAGGEIYAECNCTKLPYLFGRTTWPQGWPKSVCTIMDKVLIGDVTR